MTLRVRLPSTADVASVSAALSATLLEEHAGWLIFERGMVYVDRGRVTGLEATDTEVTAVVLGSSPYRVAIRLDDGAVLFDCSCPMGDDRAFCKHLVAVGLEAAGDHLDAWDDALPTGDLATHLQGQGLGGDGGERAELEQIEAWLADQPAERLSRLLADHAGTDPELCRELARLAAAEGRAGST